MVKKWDEKKGLCGAISSKKWKNAGIWGTLFMRSYFAQNVSGTPFFRHTILRVKTAKNLMINLLSGKWG